MGQGNEDVSQHELLQTQKCEAIVVGHTPLFCKCVPYNADCSIVYRNKIIIGFYCALIFPYPIWPTVCWENGIRICDIMYTNSQYHCCLLPG